MFQKVVSLFKPFIKLSVSHISRSKSLNLAKTMENSYKIKLSERLSTSVLPVHYQLYLNPNLETGFFNGHVNIDVNITKDQNFVALHTKFNDISIVKMYKNNVEISISKYLESKSLEQLLIHFEDKLTPGKYQLHIKFTGSLTRNIVGIYLSHLKNKGSMVASKFQPTYARQAFPCFDEPQYKATYDITLVKPLDYVALSNMNEVSKVVDAATKTEAVTFATSVPMSTYLACFVVCNFDYKESQINTNGIGNSFILRSFAQKDQMHKIDFAQDIAKRVTQYYINYYEVPFPLPKLDMIAIPDYVSGATEHWGLITYRETSFLIDDSTASSRNKISVANTIAHELAHMWFGNLVTMKWWDEVWLNEGFASYMQVKSLNAVEPSWTMLDQFLTKTLHSVLVTDAKLSSHPIVQTVETPDQITAIFDSISYNKGASVLRMLEGFVGEEKFRKGVSDYLKKYEFGNTVTKDLLMCLEPYFKKDNPNLNLLHIMDTWTKQMGYPLVNVKQGRDSSYVITQKRFLIDSDSTKEQKSEFGYRWFIPVTYKTNRGSKGSILWFPDESESVTLSLQEDDKWLKINNDQVGYFRVNYEASMWAHLTEQLKNKNMNLTISDRAHLLDDVFALAEANAVTYEVALNLSTYLTVEDDLVPWETATNVLDKLSHNLQNTEAYKYLQNYIQQLLAPLYGKQSWEKKRLTIIESLLRSRILALSTKYQFPNAETKVRNIFLSWLKSHTAIEPDLRDFVYYFGMKEASQEEWNDLWEIYLKEEDVQEQSKLRSALSAPRNIDILRRYLELAWDENNIRSQDYLNVLSIMSSNPSGANLVWDSVRENWPKLVERFTLNSRYLGSLIPSVTSYFNTEKQLQEMRAFFKQYPEAGAGEMSRVRAIENVQNNIKWADSHLDSVSSWLQNKMNNM